ncbi:hypothetical protein [Clostridium lacusfryxellense]|uniref:hypothetical protein n=1 Tax=Clostridium lacusfryxellense TaxID=205328 RepID=UPI001C0BB3E4|nr:hypothetical protein [Clostridium lacusfryxellense]MBU3111146.1 hypothetical protein [Clostridium lacusfryxellense]
MTYLDKISKNIKSKKRKQMGNYSNSVMVYAVLGVAIGGIIAGLVARKCTDEIKNIIINNANNNIDEEINTKRDEIKETLLKADVKSVGDVGMAMEDALEDLEEEQYKENEEKR